MATGERETHRLLELPGIGARHANGFDQIGTTSLKRCWELWDDAYTSCLDAAREWAKYRYYWDARTRWLFDHASERDTPLFLERRDKRNGMTAAMTEREDAFRDLAFAAQECARWNLGEPFFAEILERYGVDYRRTGQTVDVFIGQWQTHLYWEPEPCPF